MNYSVLMSVYKKENPKYLKESMESIANQTFPTNDFVLVCDGPLTEELDQVILYMKNRFGDILNVLELKNNVGLGKALNEGMKICKNELIARMDSDDISRPNRCEKQIRLFESDAELDICSGTVEEFADQISNICAKRILPENHDEIFAFAKKRCPFNHPCVMYRKNAVESAGGYQDFYRMEDYYLWIRMLMNGCKGKNISEPLLWMRAGQNMYKRRSGWDYAKSQRKLFYYMKDHHFISGFECFKSCSIRTLSALSPNCLRMFLYEKLLRKSGM